MAKAEEQKKDLVAYLQTGCRAEDKLAVGLTVEHFITHAGGDPVTYAQVQNVLRQMQAAGDMPLLQDGQYLGFATKQYGVTLEPACQLEVRIARQIVRLPLTKIYYATAQNHYVRVVTDDGECRATANFAQVQEQLQTQPEFLVCNRGVIINMSKVLRFEGDCIEMLDGTHLPVRQKDKNSLLAQFTQYQFRGMQREF